MRIRLKIRVKDGKFILSFQDLNLFRERDQVDKRDKS